MYFHARTIARITGLIMTITGLAMIPPFLCALYYNDPRTAIAMAVSCIVSVIPGALMYFLLRSSKKGLQVRDGYLTVIISWAACSLLGALPYWLSGQVPSLIDAFFESCSGYTTTGATVIIERSLTHSLLLWKAVTHWLGGMGILIFIIAVLPALGVGGHKIASAEAPWASLNKIAPRTSDLAKLLYFIYISFTLLEFILLSFSKMSLFEAIINSLGSVSTAGLLLHPDGVAFYDSFYAETVISVFTILSSVNYMMYIYIIKRNFSDLKDNVEIKVFLGIIAFTTLMITASLRISGTYDSLFTSFRHAFFQVTSISTTSGYTIGDFDVWPAFSKALLFTLFFIGGCAAATSGSIKVIRIIIMFKLIMRGFYKRLHPLAVRAVKIRGKNISAPMVSAVTSFIILYFALYLFSVLVLSVQGLDMETTLSSAAGLMSNTGVGFGEVSEGNFSCYSAPLKLYMSLLMVVGRLELFTVFLLFVPSFWNPNRSNTR